MGQISVTATAAKETHAESLLSVDSKDYAACGQWGACAQQCTLSNEISAGYICQ